MFVIPYKFDMLAELVFVASSKFDVSFKLTFVACAPTELGVFDKQTFIFPHEFDVVC